MSTERVIKPRELKFRVWDKQTKQMSPPFSLLGEFTLIGGVHAWQHECGNKASSSLEALGDLVEMQFTGFVANDGNEVFEGDFIKWGYMFRGRVEHQNEGFVRYNDDCAAFQVAYINIAGSVAWEFLHRVSIGEVIGHIYESKPVEK